MRPEPVADPRSVRGRCQVCHRQRGSEWATRPIAVGRANWLQIGGDGGLPTASVLLSVCASARRHRLDPWVYLKHVLTELPARTAGADLADLLPDRWAGCPVDPVSVPV